MHSKIAKSHFQKTLTDRIAEFIMVVAQRECELSDKTAEEWARMTKTTSAAFSESPQTYRETVASVVEKDFHLCNLLVLRMSGF